MIFFFLYRHRAATTGSVGFIRMLIESSTPSVKLRLNTADRVGENIHRRPVNPYSRKLISVHPRLHNSGNTPLHLAMDSAHAEASVVLINAGADRTRVRIIQMYGALQNLVLTKYCVHQENLDGETPELVPGVGGQEQKLARQYVIDHCGKP